MTIDHIAELRERWSLWEPLGSMPVKPAAIRDLLAALDAANAEIDRLRAALTLANERRGEACAALADARATFNGTSRTMTMRIEELRSERDAARAEIERLTRRVESAPPWPDDGKGFV